jgi:glycosyltransferase involved in cell wall biosynthesis
VKKRVLIIRHSHGLGGAERYAFQLAQELQTNGFIVYFSTNVKELKNSACSQSIKQVFIPWYSPQGWGRLYLLLEPLFVTWYYLIIRILRIDIVHPQGVDDFVFATSAAKKLKKKVIWTDHGDLKYVMRPNTSRRLKKRILFYARYARAVIAVSKSEKHEILSQSKHFPNLQVVYNGVNLPNIEKKIENSSKQLIIGATSRLLLSKGLGELIDAYALIEGNKHELWLIGSGEDELAIRELAAKRGVADRVKFFGYQSNIWPYLEAMDVYVLPTYHEAFSIALLEAGAVGKAVIVTQTGGNPELITSNTGILVPVKDPQKLADAIGRFVKNPDLRKKKGEALRKLVNKEFNFTEIVKTKIIPLYEK